MDNKYNSYTDAPSEFETQPNEDVIKDEQYRVSLVKELSPQEHLKEQIAWLQGKLWDSEEKDFIEIPGMKPFMNQEGIDMFFQYATAVLSPVVTMSNYRTDEKRIHAIISMMVKDASIHFHLHWRDYEISQKTKIHVLIDKLLILGLSAMYKALAGGDRKAATSHISESISNIQRTGFPEQQGQQRKGVFGGLFKR